MTFTTGELSKMLNATLHGRDDIMLSGFAKIEEAGKGDLSFLANPKYETHIYTTGASAVLVRRDFQPSRPVNAVLIEVDDPYESLAALLNIVEKMKPGKQGIEQPSYISSNVKIADDCYVGAFAYIGDNAKIGKNVKIYPQAYVGDGVQIGDDSIIYAGAKIYAGCKIGKRCIIHSGVVIGADGFGFAPTPEGYEKIPQIGNVELADDVEVGANTTIDRATFGSTRIGRGTKLDNLIQVAHNVALGQHNVFAAQTGIAGSTKVGDWNRVGGQVGFAGHIEIGDNNEIGAQSGIPKSVGSGNRLMGYPAIDAREFAKNLVYIKRLRNLVK